MTILTRLVLSAFVFGSLCVSAEEVSKPANPSCKSEETCRIKATWLFEKLKDNAEQLLKAKTERDVGSACYRLNEVNHVYSELMNIDFTLLTRQKIEGKSLFDLLYLTGNIKDPASEFCNIRADKNGSHKSAGDIKNIRPLFELLSRDSETALRLLTPSPKADRESSKAKP